MGLYLPASQAVHMEYPLELAYVPDGQALQVDVFPREYKPIEHKRQTVTEAA